MSNEEIYKLFRTQTKWVKFGDFLEHGIEWYWEEEDPPNVIYEEATNISGETMAKLHQASNIFGTGYLVVTYEDESPKERSDNASKV